MNPFKMNWYLATQDIDLSLKSPTQFTDVSEQFNKSLDKMIEGQKSHWFMPWNLKEAYDSPAGQLYVDAVLMIATPGLALGRRAKKIIEVTRHLSEYID